MPRRTASPVIMAPRLPSLRDSARHAPPVIFHNTTRLGRSITGLRASACAARDATGWISGRTRTLQADLTIRSLPASRYRALIFLRAVSNVTREIGLQVRLRTAPRATGRCTIAWSIPITRLRRSRATVQYATEQRIGPRPPSTIRARDFH
jgi:hypothetical protein